MPSRCSTVIVVVVVVVVIIIIIIRRACRHAARLGHGHDGAAGKAPAQAALRRPLVGRRATLEDPRGPERTREDPRCALPSDGGLLDISPHLPTSPHISPYALSSEGGLRVWLSRRLRPALSESDAD